MVEIKTVVIIYFSLRICLTRCVIFRNVKGKVSYLVKWQELPYNLSTWEDADDDDNSQIR